MIEKMSEWLLKGNNLAYATSALVFACIFMYIFYNAMSFYILKERYHGIRFTTKNIAYMTMFTAISVSITIVISLTVPITVFPPIRVGFEGVMIKITGFILGPIVGVIVGLITEALVMIFVPSFIHPAYTLVAVAYGFVAGIGSSFLRAGKGKEWLMMLLIHLFLLIFGGFIFILIGSYKEQVEILGFKMSPETYRYIFVVIIVLTALMVWIVYVAAKIVRFKKISSEVRNLKEKYSEKSSEEIKKMALSIHKPKFLRTFLPIFLLATAAEFIVTTLMSAWGDAGFLGITTDGGYSGMVIARLIQAPIKIISNSFILYFTFSAVRPLIKRDR